MLLIALVAFVTLAVLAVGGVFGYQWWRDRPANAALSASNAAVDRVLDKMGDADSLQDVAGAGSLVSKSMVEIKQASADLAGEQSQLAIKVEPVITAQGELLEALAPIEGLSAESLATWGKTLPAVQDAQSTLLAARRSLSSYDEGAGEQVRDPRADLDHTISVVGDSAVASLTDELTTMLADLDKASTTGAAAIIGERATPMTDSATAAQVGQTGPAADSLVALGDAFGAIAPLADMDPENLDMWDDSRLSLASATGELGLDAEAALDSMTAWVQSATARMASWRSDYESAQTARSSATADLDEYSESAKRILRRYNRARDATADALEAAELDDSSASYTVEYAMEEGYLTRQGLLDELRSLYVPSVMATTHSSLAGVLDAAISAMEVGEQAVEDWNACYYDCPPTFRDMEDWQRFSDQSAVITGDFDAARKAWVSALNGALSQANAVPLPPMPKV